MSEKNWANSEVEFLRENYLTLMVKEIAEKLGKSFHAVKHQIKKQELGGKYGKWTESDNQFLRDNLDMPLKEMSVILGKTVANIKTQHRRLGITKYNGNTVKYPEIYHSWALMKARCGNENCKSYKDYGARGIFICEEWMNNSEKFIEWSLNNGWKSGLSIDRINNDDGYYPENCRWATKTQQANNTRKNIFLTAFGETKTLKEWSRDTRCKVAYHVLFRRYNKNELTPEQMISTNITQAKLVTAWEETKTIKEWARDIRCKFSEKILRKRLNSGFSSEDAISGVIGHE